MRRYTLLVTVGVGIVWVLVSALAFIFPIPLARALGAAATALLIVGGGVGVAVLVYAALVIVPAFAARISASRGVNMAYDSEEGVVGIGTVVVPKGDLPPRTAQVLAVKAIARHSGVIEGIPVEEQEEQTFPKSPRFYLP